MAVITYPCYNLNLSMLVKGANVMNQSFRSEVINASLEFRNKR